MRVRVNKDLCSACGVCEGLVPEVFSLETEPYAVVLLDPVPEELEDLVREAAEIAQKAPLRLWKGIEPIKSMIQ